MNNSKKSKNIHNKDIKVSSIISLFYIIKFKFRVKSIIIRKEANFLVKHEKRWN